MLLGSNVRLIETEHPDATLETAVKLALEIDAPRRMVVADSVQTIRTTNDQKADPEDREAISAFMWTARHLAKKHDLILVVIAQLSRISYKNKKDAQDLNPLAMFAGSRAIEHASDVAILLEQPNENDVSRCVVARNRLGDKGAFYVKLDRTKASLVHVDEAEATGAEEGLQAEQRARKLANAKDRVRDILRAFPGIGKRALRKRAGVSNPDCDAAVEEMLHADEIRIETQGKLEKHYLKED